MEEMDVEVARPRQVRYQAALRPDIAALLSLVHRGIEVGFPAAPVTKHSSRHISELRLAHQVVSIFADGVSATAASEVSSRKVKVSCR
jgi:hypothetical protein